MRSLLNIALTGAGYEVSEVASGSALLNELRTAVTFGVPDPPRLIISDIRMPGWTGLEVLAIAQMLDSDLAFVLITAFGDGRTHELAKELGAVAVFDKPFDIDELIATVRLHVSL